MKVKKIYALLIPLTIGMASLTSCSSDNNNDNNTHPERGDVTSFDQVKYLQNSIVEIDSTGKMVQRVSGKPLDAADTTVLSIHAADVNAAAEIFKDWLSPDTKVSTISPSTVDLQADLKDENGKDKETVYFKAVTGGDNVAEVTFKNGGVLKHFSKIKFVSSWPENGKSPYKVGETVVNNTYNEGYASWVCVREAQNGVAGLLVFLSEKTCRADKTKSANFATPPLARAASDVMKKDWDNFVTRFKSAGRELTIEYFWINDSKYFVFGAGIYAIRLIDTDIDWFDIIWKDPQKRYIQIRTFGLGRG